jgi:ribonuclease HI
MRLGEVPDDDFHCPRGLENKTRNGACQRKQRKIQGWTAVFEEQELQKHEGIQDADLMATRYLLATKQCAFEAYNLGLLDEVAAFSDSQLMRKVMPMEHECAKKRTVPMSGIFGKRSRPLQLFCA